MARTTEVKPRNDAYTGLLAISFLALVAATVLMLMDTESLGKLPYRRCVGLGTPQLDARQRGPADPSGGRQLCLRHCPTLPERPYAGQARHRHLTVVGVAGIAEQPALLLPAFLTSPLDVLGQDGRNMGWIRGWTHGVVDGCLGALRMSDSGTNGSADSRSSDGHTQNRHSGETHTRLLV